MRKKFHLFHAVFLSIISIFIDWNICVFDNANPPIGLVYAQSAKYPYKRRDNRKEGIVKPKQLVSGETLALISASIENSEEPPEEIKEYSLVFYLEKDSRVNVVVREFVKLYKMQPVQRKFPSGICRFSWPSEIPNFYKIGQKDLSPLAKIGGSAGKQLAPVAIFSSDFAKAGSGYRFCFIPRHAVSTLEYKIYPAESLEPIYSSKLSDLKADSKACLNWNGRDQSDETMSDGWYTLFVEATFKARPGSGARTVTSNYEFYHHAYFFKDE